MVSANATKTTAILEKKLLLDQMKEIQQNIDGTKVQREEVSKYWEDLINEHIRKRCTCGCCYK
jgi:hypothetical protein